MPFSNLWTDRRGAAFDRGFAQYFWRQRGRWSPESWALPFAVRWEGRAIGIQQIEGQDFPVLRAVGTGSWLGRRYQGHGFGTEMRAAVLSFAFAGLLAECAVSGA